MSSGAWSRRVAGRARTLRGLVRDTQRALHDVIDILHFDPEISVAVQETGRLCSRPTALVVLGTSAGARARLLHCLLGRRLLPDPAPRGCRWIRIQYGSGTQVRLTLGSSEFEVVDELECNKHSWDTIPLEDLLRQEQTDLSTLLDIELNNTFLKDGLKIIVPPDIATDPEDFNYTTLKKIHADLYAKREFIMKSVNPVFLYAVDSIGRNVFSENVSSSRIVSSTSEEEFFASFNMYMTSGVSDREHSENKCCDSRDVFKVRSESAVFTSENCLDLYQVKEMNPNSQLLFVLFSDSVNMTEERGGCDVDSDVTESTEDRLYRSQELPESEQRERDSPGRGASDARRLHEEQSAFMNDLLDQWELMTSPPPKHYVKSQWVIVDDVELMRTAEQKALAPYLSGAIQNAGDTCVKSCKREEEKRVGSRAKFLAMVVKFATECSQSYLLEYCTRLSEMHVKLLQRFILASFDMARELQVVPKKIQYVARQEHQLYETINEKFSEGEKKQELLRIMQDVLQEMRSEVNSMDWSVDDLPWHQDQRFVISNSIFYSSSRSSPELSILSRPTCLSDTIQSASYATCQMHDQTASDGEEAESYDSYNLDDYEIIQSTDESYSECYRVRSKPADTSSVTSQIGDIRIENEESDLCSVSRAAWSGAASTRCTNSINISVKQASLDVQQAVLSKLSRKISLKLVKFVDCLKDSYFGTLQRCLESLESSCRQELGGRPASEAMRQLLSVARQVDLQPCASFSILRSLIDSIRRLFHKLRIVSGEAEDACCVLSPVWRRHVALQTTHSLSPQRLARVISTQILDRLGVAHERYQSALATLESALASRLHHTEDVKLAIRKKYAPSFARLCLESTSMCDLLMYGTPELGREIGRGQYGVVYAARGGWAGRAPAAVKSVLPSDERHYHELAMEFFYTRSIPSHPRIVRLLGSVVQRAGSGPSVLLVSERKCRDLHAAVRAGLAFAPRMRVALDIVEGIRYLHSLGLVHRDIKMKNVLLDRSDRAALSDLGFCAAEALISGSVVGTPVHMAPELLAGEYDASVDVYAFGILFWYVCAGNIKLPSAFEVFQNKEQLWSKVKRGLRPERLPHFTDECWDVMTSCWASEPTQRALLGDVHDQLEGILQQALTDGEVQPAQDTRYDSDDSLMMTGVEGDMR